ncbi:MAG TPA: PLP-dependent lyase/thiolase [Ilumatobacteraceae bacterium]|nr:PLP-dependent lyase/thiolase [Ilumatobacteraceae bacterium]
MNAGRTMRVTGWRCAVCAATVDIAAPFPWRCPNSTAHDRRHVLQIVEDDGHADGEHPDDGFAPGSPRDPAGAPDVNPYLRYDAAFAWAAYAEANGLDATARRHLVIELDEAVRAVAGTSFVPTPFGRSAALSDALGFRDGGGVWVKDETGGVGGSQKARHLFTILLHLRAAELLGHLVERPPLAIASCGNAALAAATLARAADWPIDVYVPTWMSDGFGVELDRLGARTHRCARRAADPPGDPAMFRFREAVAAGAIPFTVQGPENALALDGGRTIGWEIVDQVAEQRTGELDRIFVQVGGGAFASCVGAAHPARRFHAVQAEGCAPLARAWERALEAGTDGLAHVAAPLWAEVMTPWPDPHSLADGILDDETYDWIGVFAAIGSWGDAPIVAAESDIVAAHQLARRSGFDVSATGSAGLAGLLAVIDVVAPTERVAVVMSGVAR